MDRISVSISGLIKGPMVVYKYPLPWNKHLYFWLSKAIQGIKHVDIEAMCIWKTMVVSVYKTGT